MTEKEAIAYFAGITLNFQSYEKKEFTYRGEKEGNLVSVKFQCTSDIYSDSFDAKEKFETNYDLEWFNATFSASSDKEENGKPFYTFVVDL